jgi:6-phosphogluconolactonase (cycloisomerase 2 family)
MGWRSRLAALLTLLGGLLGAVAVEAQDELFVGNFNGNSVTVYSRTAGGNTPPLRTLFGAATGMSSPQGLALDTINNELIVANAGHAITVYARTASGNTPALRAISGGSTGLSSPRGVAVDLTNNEIVVANFNTSSVTVYSRTANGNVAPLRTLSGASTGLALPRGLALDLTNNELFIVNSNDTVTVYSRTASGNTAPLRTIAGGSTGLAGATAIAVDHLNNELFVTNSLNQYQAITVHNRAANGNVAPVRIITGLSTGLSDTRGLTIDLTNNQLVVANFGNIPAGNSITTYSRTANGNVPPQQTLTGAATGLNGVFAVAVTASLPPVDRDFNGDGRADILWRDASGTLALWLMNGTGVISSSLVGTVTLDWTIVGIGDFNGDGRADILWRHSSGSVAVWLMNGTTVSTAGMLGIVTADWTVAGIQDVNGDARSDVVWRHSSGAVSIWLMNGTAVVGTGSPGGAGPEWQIQ